MHFNDEYFTSVINAFEKLNEVDSVVLGGSRSTGETMTYTFIARAICRLNKRQVC